MNRYFVYDIETYPNVFTFAGVFDDNGLEFDFEISTYRSDAQQFYDFICWLAVNNYTTVGFNNLGFDYPIIHYIMKNKVFDPALIYKKVQEIFAAQNDESQKQFNTIKPSDCIVKQLDLFKIHHFDNKARMTGLKMLEFNMRSDNISDLPFPVGKILTREEVPVLKAYNRHDVNETRKFLHHTLPMIKLRNDLTYKYQDDFSNFSDVKIGTEIFKRELLAAGVQVYDYTSKGRTSRQTKRNYIDLHECIPKCIKLDHPEFNRIKNYFQHQRITETKGVFKDLEIVVDGIDIAYGTGGIHGSVTNCHYESDSENIIVDIDGVSLYPSIGITQGYYPEHLTPKFVQVNAGIKDKRTSYSKETTENKTYKLALNGVYGDSNNPYSIFFDPLFTMKITIGGQLMISMLIDRLMTIPGYQMIQCNTDGITSYIKRAHYDQFKRICDQWSIDTMIKLEEVHYKRFFVRDVNSYIGESVNGKIKRIGAYEYEKEWHQDQSGLVIPKVAELKLLQGVSIRDTVKYWQDKMDFMMRVKVPKTSRLVYQQPHGDVEMEKTLRYYPSEQGYPLFKIMPPLAKKPGVYRQIAVESGWNVHPCNNIKDATLPINHEYYIQEIEKLTLPLLARG